MIDTWEQYRSSCHRLGLMRELIKTIKLISIEKGLDYQMAAKEAEPMVWLIDDMENDLRDFELRHPEKL